MRTFLTAVGEEVLRVEHVTEFLLIPTAGDELPGRQRRPVLGDQHAVLSLWNTHDRNILSVIEHIYERDQVKSRPQDAGLRPILTVEGNDLTGLHAVAQIDPFQLTDRVLIDDHERCAEQHQRAEYETHHGAEPQPGLAGGTGSLQQHDADD